MIAEMHRFKANEAERSMAPELERWNLDSPKNQHRTCTEVPGRPFSFEGKYILGTTPG